MTFNLISNDNSQINVNSGASSDAIPVCSEVSNDLVGEILHYVHPDDLISKSEVSKLWNKMVNEIPAYGLEVFNADAWEKLGYTIEGEIPPFSSRINQVTRSFRRCFQGENGVLSFSAILMPKGLTLDKMEELMERKGIKYSTICLLKKARKLANKPIERS